MRVRSVVLLVCVALLGAATAANAARARSSPAGAALMVAMAGARHKDGNYVTVGPQTDAPQQPQQPPQPVGPLHGPMTRDSAAGLVRLPRYWVIYRDAHSGKFMRRPAEHPDNPDPSESVSTSPSLGALATAPSDIAPCAGRYEQFMTPEYLTVDDAVVAAMEKVPGPVPEVSDPSDGVSDDLGNPPNLYVVAARASGDVRKLCPLPFARIDPKPPAQHFVNSATSADPGQSAASPSRPQQVVDNGRSMKAPTPFQSGVDTGLLSPGERAYNSVRRAFNFGDNVPKCGGPTPIPKCGAGYIGDGYTCNPCPAVTSVARSLSFSALTARL